MRDCNPFTDSGGGFSLLRYRPEAVHHYLTPTTTSAFAQLPLVNRCLDRDNPWVHKRTKG